MIQIACFSADPNAKPAPQFIDTFTSYSFDRSVMTPAAAFRFTAPGVDKAKRMAIRSGDKIQLSIKNDAKTTLVGTGFIDETDMHIAAHSLEYVITGRDTIGALVDNDAVDIKNQIILYERANLDTVMAQMLANTRMPKEFITQQLDRNFRHSLNTSPGETKINVIQRLLEYVNGLIWAAPDGRAIVDKPDFRQKVKKGSLSITEGYTNILEARVRRNVNQSIRQIVTLLTGTEASSATTASQTLQNMDKTLQAYRGSNVGRSISRTFSYESGTDIINQQGIARGGLAPHTLAQEYSAREIARENVRILDVEAVVEGHFNEGGELYDVDQMYQVNIEDEDVSEPLYVYAVSYELTEHGMMTRMRLCRPYTICAYCDQLPQIVAPVSRR